MTATSQLRLVGAVYAVVTSPFSAEEQWNTGLQASDAAGAAPIERINSRTATTRCVHAWLTVCMLIGMLVHGLLQLCAPNPWWPWHLDQQTTSLINAVMVVALRGSWVLLPIRRSVRLAVDAVNVREGRITATLVDCGESSWLLLLWAERASCVTTETLSQPLLQAVSVWYGYYLSSDLLPAAAVERINRALAGAVRLRRLLQLGVVAFTLATLPHFIVGRVEKSGMFTAAMLAVTVCFIHFSLAEFLYCLVLAPRCKRQLEAALLAENERMNQQPAELDAELCYSLHGWGWKGGAVLVKGKS